LLKICSASSKTTKGGFGTYLAANYDELVDAPIEMGKFWSGSFVAGGIPHRFVVAGDEWLGVEVGAGKSASQWRLTKLDELLVRDNKLVGQWLN